MPPTQSEAPALFSLLVFLGVNYAVGYAIGHWLLHSTVGAIALALIAPCLSLLGVALFGARPRKQDSRPDQA